MGGDEDRIEAGPVERVLHRGTAPRTSCRVKRNIDVDDARILEFAKLPTDTRRRIIRQRVGDLAPVGPGAVARERGKESHQLQTNLSAKDSGGHKNLIRDRGRSRFVVRPRHSSMMPHTGSSRTSTGPHNAVFAFVNANLALITPYLVLSCAPGRWLASDRPQTSSRRPPW